MNLNMPSVPKADLIAVAQAAVAVAVAFGAPLNADQQKSLLALATVIAAILVTADVKRRGNRLAHADKVKAMTDPTVRADTVIATIEKLAGASFEEIQAALPKPQPFTVSGTTTTTGGGSTTTVTVPPAKKKAPPKKKP